MIMNLKPSGIISSFELNKILSFAQELCKGELAIRYFEIPHFHLDINELTTALLRVEEFKKSLLSTNPLSINDYHDVTESVNQNRILDFVLTEEDLHRINIILKSSEYISNYFSNEKRTLYPSLTELASNFFDLNLLSKSISQIIDEKGEFKENASPKLLSISKSILSKQYEINKVFNQIASDLKNKGLLSENVETYRNGRRVLSLPVENKRKVRGIIHDESSTGKTVFVEPEQIIDLNNDLYDLENEYKKEIYEILKKISSEIRPFAEEIIANLLLVSEFDIISAKGKLAIKLNSFRPKLSEKPKFNFKKAFHPLLALRNAKTGLETIPFDFEPSEDDRIVVISGPNAGGKSITLKSIGLLQMMLQCGFLIPVDENSEFGIFFSIFADIGDQQSVDDDLSTYSSRLRNMKEFLHEGNENSLILIDEFGTGTDPKIGGAIAEAVLHELNRLKVFAVITTHYSNLKLYAFKNKGVLNASMHFDKENLKPTYRFIPGKPGSSFAFEMAQNSGLSKKLLNYARFKAGKNIKKIEDILVELQESKHELEVKILELKEKELILDKLVAKNQNLFSELDFGRKKLKLEKKEFLAGELNKRTLELNKLIKEISQQNKLEDAKKLHEKLIDDKKKVETELTISKSELNKTSVKKVKEIKIGDYVRLKSGGLTGKLVKIAKSIASVQTSSFQIEVPIHELEYTNKPIEVFEGRSINTNLEDTGKFQTSLDIRGYTKSEAMEALHSFFDNAILSNTTLLKILHGKGNGTLKNLVRQLASEYKDYDQIWHPDPDQGGDGISFVKFK